MVDKQCRLKAAGLIQDFKNGRITNDEFVDRFPRSTDKAIQAISSMLCFSYSDVREHRLVGKHALTAKGEQLFDRCILFLGTDLEYSGETSFIDLFAPLKRLWRGLTRSQKQEIAPWWPFDSDAQLIHHERLMR